MPMKVTAVAAAGEVHPNPFVGPVNHTAVVRADVSDLSSYEVDSLGYLKPGVFLTRAGQLVEPEAALLTIATLRPRNKSSVYHAFGSNVPCRCMGLHKLPAIRLQAATLEQIIGMSYR